MIQIRSNIFETNSSSTHVLIIDREEWIQWYPHSTERYIDDRKYEITCDYYGRSPMAPLFTTTDKLKYLWTAAISLWYPTEWFEGHLDKIDKFQDTVHSFMPNAILVVPDIKSLSYGIDHVNELEPLMEECLTNPKLLENFIVNDRSAIYVGGDETPSWDCWFIPYQDADGYLHKTPLGADMYYYVKGN